MSPSVFERRDGGERPRGHQGTSLPVWASANLVVSGGHEHDTLDGPRLRLPSALVGKLLDEEDMLPKMLA